MPGQTSGTGLLPKERAKKPAREIVRETLTPQRLSMLSWAGAAALFACVGLASFQFAGGMRIDTVTAPEFAGMPLPGPGGSVETTASIRTPQPAIALYDQVASQNPSPGIELDEAQAGLLREEIIRLRRRLNALSEQNLSYSRRIAALEKQVALLEASTPAGSVLDREPIPLAKPTPHPIPPQPGIVSQAYNTPAQPAGTGTSAAAPSAEVSAPSARERIESVPAPETTGAFQKKTLEQIIAERKLSLPAPAPVRIVSLNKTIADGPVTTGSISPATSLLPPETAADTAQTAALSQTDASSEPAPAPADADPVSSLRPKLITPTAPAGRTKGGGKSKIRQTQFGALIGTYGSEDAAREAWIRFAKQNEERMRDLRPRILPAEPDGSTMTLLVGPFGNASEASVACLRLLEVKDLCRPTLFSGEELVITTR
ncbi:hypothetical protein E1178_19185 [Roseibium hamelinense]|nr:hypothetical protein [Roseibium hamelinense]MTI45734.1 hypothetical protein [Roseibium hamelinense]